jgi:predicted molibdopterin-dependent oxidoreductase YjgC
MIPIELGNRLDSDFGPQNLDQIWAELSKVSPIHSHLNLEVIRNSQREGILVSGKTELSRSSLNGVPELREGMLRLVATRSMYDCGVLMTNSPSLRGLAPGTRMGIRSDDLERLGIADGERVRAVGGRGEIVVTVVSDPEAAPGTAHLIWNQDGPDPGDLIDSAMVVTDLKLERR